MGDTTRPELLGESTLAALARAAPGQQRPWSGLDLSVPEQRIFGDYELLEKCGEGGMGVVYRAHQRSLDREVAIKFISADLTRCSSMVDRFRAEAQAAARLHHRHIVPVFEVGQVEGLHFFTMPLLRGRALEVVGKERALSITECVALMGKLASAVAYAHRAGLLHLDLKPANVIFDEHGEPLIGDFGLARRVDDDGGVDSQEVSGTPGYMAPEQILIKRYRLSPATDVYALGAMLYWLLVGNSPHGSGSSQQLMDNASRGRVRPLRELRAEVPRDLAAICDHCLALRSEDRYPNAFELQCDLERLAAGEAISIRPPGPLEKFQRAMRRHPRLVASTTTALLLAVAASAAGTWWYGRVEQARQHEKVATIVDTMKLLRQAEAHRGAIGTPRADGKLYRQDGKCFNNRVRMYGTVFELVGEVPCPEAEPSQP